MAIPEIDCCCDPPPGPKAVYLEPTLCPNYTYPLPKYLVITITGGDASIWYATVLPSPGNPGPCSDFNVASAVLVNMGHEPVGSPAQDNCNWRFFKSIAGGFLSGAVLAVTDRTVAGIQRSVRWFNADSYNLASSSTVYGATANALSAWDWLTPFSGTIDQHNNSTHDTSACPDLSFTVEPLL